LVKNFIFSMSYVQQLITNSNDLKVHKIIWKNPRPSWTRFCRPINFQFPKESAQLALNEERHYRDLIDKLIVEVKHSLQSTMVDAKIFNALSDTSATKCYICKAMPTNERFRKVFGKEY